MALPGGGLLARAGAQFLPALGKPQGIESQAGSRRKGQRGQARRQARSQVVYPSAQGTFLDGIRHTAQDRLNAV